MRYLLSVFKKHTLTSLFLVASSILGTAYIFQYGFDYAPCDLCYKQRYPYMAIIALSGFWVIKNDVSNKTTQIITLICGLLLVGNGVLGGFHAGVEYGWWQGPTACTSGVQLTGSVEERLAQLMAAPLVRCDVPAWTLFNISMAGYNFFIASFFGLLTINTWINRKK